MNSDFSPDDIKHKKTRDASMKDGAASSVMTGAADPYVSPYALEVGASNFQIGLLTSLSGLAGPLIQIVGSRLIEKFNRRKIVLVSVISQATALLLFIVIGAAYLVNKELSFLSSIFIAAYVVYAVSGALGGPAWFSMLGDAVPEKMRGRYFSRRNRLTNFTNISITMAGAVLLYYLKSFNLVLFGFLILFGVASLARYVSAFFINHHHAGKIELAPDYFFPFWQFLRRAPFNNFGRFVLYSGLLNLAVNIANPFYAIYMWKNLHFNPIWFMAVTISLTFFSAIFMPWWGKFADKFGNRELLKVGSWLIVPASALWVVSANPLYLVFVPQLLMGIGWSAVTLASSNFIYDNVSVPRRALCVTYYNLTNGAGIFLGATLGGLIAQHAAVTFANTLLLVFVVSTVARGAVPLLFLSKIKEVRAEIAAPPEYLFSYVNIGQITPMFIQLKDKISPFVHKSMVGLKLKKKEEVIN